MRLIFLLLLAALAEGAQTQNDAVTRLLSKTMRVRHPELSRLEVTNVRLRSPVGENTRISWMSNNRFGWVQFELEWDTADQGSVKTFGTATVEGFGKVAVALRPIAALEPFSEANINFEEQKLSSLMVGGYYLSLEPLQGVVARTPIRPGRVLTPAFIQKPYLLNRGQMVDLVHEKGGLRVSARVEAMDRGRANDWVRVRNPSSSKVIRARVSNDGTVRMK